MDNEYSQFEEEWSYKPEPPLPLYAAASNGDYTKLERLLKISTDTVNRRGNADLKMWLPWSKEYVSNKATSAYEAAALGFLDILRLLIEREGLRLSVVLYSVVDCGRLECVKEMFAWLVNNKRNEFDDGVAISTAMAWALKIAAAGWRDDIVEFLLIASGHANKKFVDYAFIKAMIPQDDWPRRNCVLKGPYEEARKERIKVVRLLLEAGADVEVTSRLEHYRHKYEETKPLHRVAQEGNRAREIFDMLLDKNVDVNSVNNEGTNMLGHYVITSSL
ncbi:hypothetical protein BKA61DRAFT_686364 [Leptodontidium sp. MPI-SDFR-AT-0119]|nr:hypothetical protein BKA61DRAFT_686364 [Leptodontidium sp. MPI-SDFR-AT-0119]